jgi:hypothetical protein
MVDHDLTHAQLMDGYDACIKNVQNLLYSAKLLLEHENSLQYALGLYLYAIEEYGKAEILREYLQDNKSKYSIPEWIFGKGKFGREAHNNKLVKGLEKLPHVCSILSPTAEITTNSAKRTHTIVLKKNGVPCGIVSVGDLQLAFLRIRLISRAKKYSLISKRDVSTLIGIVPIVIGIFYYLRIEIS